MKAVETKRMLLEHGRRMLDVWVGFWCEPEDGSHLAFTRVLLGSIFLYSLIMYTPDLREFFSNEGWWPASYLKYSSRAPYNLTWLRYINSLPLLYTAHALAIVVAALFTAGVGLALTAPATALIALAYISRNEWVVFGFDQVLTPLLLFMVFHRRRHCLGNRLARRLMQTQLCLVYLGAGFSKMTHPAWFDGTGLWRVVATFETRRSEFDWLVAYTSQHPQILVVAGAVVALWECSYPVLVWIRPLRPFVLLMALAVHGGIGVFMRLGEFAAVMLAANTVFVDAQVWRRAIWDLKRRLVLRSKVGTIVAKPPLYPVDEIKEDTYA